MILALLTTMNSKVKVHVVDGSKCVLDCRHDKEEPGQGGQPSSGRLGACLALCASEQNKTGFGAGLRVHGAAKDTRRFRIEATEPPGGDNGVKSLVSFPEEPCHTHECLFHKRRCHGRAAERAADR